ncbi:hypothetical protein KPL71_015466 [Citrus sinensis]|uniref:Uncharacterized protein n=1 Tax=Citrus sinensis TaxID=2711 RepID=A0ACB8KJM4_CITSI|nr:hypothetical protein KPL71_015466 [Citrus sinensis]
MDTKELIRKCSAITLQEEENDKIEFFGSMKEEGQKIAANCLVGKIMLNKGVSIEGLRAALQQVWRSIKEFKVESAGNNVFIFKFNSEEEKRRVFIGGPWHFAGALIVMIEPKGIGNVNEQTFTHASFWVQIHNVPIMCMQKCAVQKLGEKIGEVKEIETDEDGECIGIFARLRISVDIMQPLKKILFIEVEGKKKIPMAMVYERLPDFCFCCGILGHQFRECLKYQGQPKENLPYGSWLRAKTAAEIAKFYKNKEKWSNEHQKPSSPPANSRQQQVQQWHASPVLESGSEATCIGKNKNTEQPKVNQVAEVFEVQLMHRVEESRQQLIDCKAQASTADNIGSMSTLNKKEGNNGRESTDIERGKERATKVTHQKSIQYPEENNKEGKISGPRNAKLKPKGRKWKFQARNLLSRRDRIGNPPGTKRHRNEENELSPEKKD